MATGTYRLPPRFYWDHASRDLPAGRVVRETKRHVYVEADADTYAELLSDARHYADSMVAGGFDDMGLVASARATVAALVAAGAPCNATETCYHQGMAANPNTQEAPMAANPPLLQVLATPLPSAIDPGYREAKNRQLRARLVYARANRGYLTCCLHGAKVHAAVTEVQGHSGALHPRALCQASTTTSYASEYDPVDDEREVTCLRCLASMATKGLDKDWLVQQAPAREAAPAAREEATMATSTKQEKGKAKGAGRPKKPQLPVAQVKADMEASKAGFDAYEQARLANGKEGVTAEEKLANEGIMEANRPAFTTYWRGYNDPRIKAERDKARAKKQAAKEKEATKKAEAKAAKAAKAEAAAGEPGGSEG